jgi:hypothetical protein
MLILHILTNFSNLKLKTIDTYNIHIYNSGAQHAAHGPHVALESNQRGPLQLFLK